MKKLLNKLNERLNNDYKKYIEDLQLLDKTDLINQSYNIATVNNFYDALTYYLEDECNEFPLEKESIKIILKYKGNILTWFQNTWFSCMHPERFDFWYDYYTIIEIIEWAIKSLKE